MLNYDRSGKHDVLLAQWWARMAESGDIAKAFQSDLFPLGAFMAHWRGGNRALVFDTDADGITVAVWFQTMLSGAFMGCWVRPDCRRWKATLEAIQQALRSALVHWPVIISTTRHEKLLRTLERLGYDVVGQIPNLWDGEPVWVAVLTREKAAHEHRQGRRASAQYSRS